MFERFTDRARRVVVLAQEESRLLHHDHIGTEHLLLGLIHERDGVAAVALETMGVDLATTRAEVEEMVGRGTAAPSGHIPFTPPAKKVLELSLREALQLGHNYIGTEHLLLGLLREESGVAARVLAALGVDVSTTRRTVVDIVAGRASEGRAAIADLDSAAAEAEQLALARQGLLRRLLRDETSLLHRALEEHGVRPDDLQITLDRLLEEDDQAND
jgi:ATP-dependent Clp protease ATP-binding subunit ClpC